MGSSSQHVLIAANPKSGASSSQSRVASLRDALTTAGYVCHVQHSLEQLQRDCVALDAAGELRAIVSAGGDGTADALANLLPSHVPMLIFPLGTENLLAKHLGISGDITQARDMLQAHQCQALDVGCANGKLFLVMLSCGFDAEVVRHMHAMRTGHINRWSYARPIFSSLAKYGFPQLEYETLHAENETGASQHARSQAAWLFVFNVPRYAASLNFCPQADPTDGMLDVCTFKRSGIAAGLGYLTRLCFGSHQRMRGFQHQLCHRLEIFKPLGRRGEPLDIPFQIDGDPGGVLPLKIEVLPGRLSVLVPTR